MRAMHWQGEGGKARVAGRPGMGGRHDRVMESGVQYTRGARA